jgi:D-sedoheptulose 7-phosphate isomerase
MSMSEQRIQQQFFESADLQYQSAETLARPIAQAATALHGALTGGGKIMVCGSGPGAVLAPLLAQLFVTRFERERPPLAALALGVNAAQQVRVRWACRAMCWWSSTTVRAKAHRPSPRRRTRT